MKGEMGRRKAWVGKRRLTEGSSEVGSLYHLSLPLQSCLCQGHRERCLK